MASTLQQLLQRQRGGRVQTGDLPDARVLQAAIRSGGQYNVQVQQAGKSKLTELAEGLSKINPALQNYAAGQETELAMYKEEVARLSPEEVKAKLNQTEEALDKEVRRGNIPFLGSPLNWRRKKRALGAALHDDFERAISDRLNNPEEGDDDLPGGTADIIDLVRKDFGEEYGGLDNPLIAEGFQEAINPTVQKYVLSYDAQKSREAKINVARESGNKMYRLWKDINWESASGELDALAIKEAYEDLNTFSPEIQLATIKGIAKSLAFMDEIKANQFVEWAEDNLKIGNAKFATYAQEVDGLYDVIESIAEKEGLTSDRDRKDKVASILGEFQRHLSEITYRGTTEVDGQTFSDDAALRKYFHERIRDDDDDRFVGEASKALDVALASDYDREDIAFNELRNETQAYRTAFRDINGAVTATLATGDFALTEQEQYLEPEVIALRSRFQTEMEGKLNNKAKQILADNPNMSRQLQAQRLNEFYTEEIEKFSVKIQNAGEKLLEDREKREKKEDPPAKSEVETEAPSAPWFIADSPKQKTVKIEQAFNLLRNANAAAEERTKALDYLKLNQPAVMKHYAEIAKPGSSVTFPAVRGLSPSRTQPYTPTERLNAGREYTKLLPFTLGKMSEAIDDAASAGLTGTRLLTSDGFTFEASTYSFRSAMLLPLAYVKDPSTNKKAITDILKLLGRGTDDDSVELAVRRQRKLYQEFGYIQKTN
tara:strand:- start:4164 stop:6308 length:2145 start_codon:yes stop_codon:yes gene_type:complete